MERSRPHSVSCQGLGSQPGTTSDASLQQKLSVMQKLLQQLCRAGQQLKLQVASILAATVAAANVLCMPVSALAETTAPPYQQADQTADTQQAKTQPLAQDKQSAATNSSSQLPALPTSFPLLPDVVVQPPQEVLLQSTVHLLCLLLHCDCVKGCMSS